MDDRPLNGDYGLPGRRPRGEVDWTRHVHTADIAGSSLHYLDYGDPGPEGLVFVLAHGLGGRWQHWRENIPELAEHGRVIAIDLPGFGRSGPLPGGYSIDAFADAIAELLKQLDLPKVVFVGHSIGGLLAVRFANRHPDLVGAIVLAATYFEVLTAGLPIPALLRNQLIERPRLRRVFLWPYLHRPGALPSTSVALLVDGVGARGVLPTARAVGKLRHGEWLTQVSRSSTSLDRSAAGRLGCRCASSQIGSTDNKRTRDSGPRSLVRTWTPLHTGTRHAAQRSRVTAAQSSA